MIYATTPEEIEARRKAFIRKWRLKHRAVADSLEEAGDRLFTFVRLPPSQWRSVRTTNAIRRLHEEFTRRIKTRSRSGSGSSQSTFASMCHLLTERSCAIWRGGGSQPRSQIARLKWRGLAFRPSGDQGRIARPWRRL